MIENCPYQSIKITRHWGCNGVSIYGEKHILCSHTMNKSGYCFNWDCEITDNVMKITMINRLEG